MSTTPTTCACGALNAAGARFCNACGRSLTPTMRSRPDWLLVSSLTLLLVAGIGFAAKHWFKRPALQPVVAAAATKPDPSLAPCGHLKMVAWKEDIGSFGWCKEFHQFEVDGDEWKRTSKRPKQGMGIPGWAFLDELKPLDPGSNRTATCKKCGKVLRFPRSEVPVAECENGHPHVSSDDGWVPATAEEVKALSPPAGRKHTTPLIHPVVEDALPPPTRLSR